MCRGPLMDSQFALQHQDSHSDKYYLATVCGSDAQLFSKCPVGR